VSTFLDFCASPEKASHHLAWCAENERAVRADERKQLARLLAASIDRGQYVTLQRALSKLDPDTRSTCATLVSTLTDLLGDQQAEAA
jgi:hypothetical protein